MGCLNRDGFYDDDAYDDDAYLKAEADTRARYAYELDANAQGIADGKNRKAINRYYRHEPAYLAGHRTGLALPAEPADA